jgi:hypothetical protein
MTKRGRKPNPPALAANDGLTDERQLDPPSPMLPSLEAEQQKLETIVESPLADFLAIVKALPPYPRRLLLILFEYRWPVALLGERELLTKAIQTLERALETREQGYSVRDLDALDEIGWLIGGDRNRRREGVIAQRQTGITKKAVDGNREKGNRTRALVIAKAIELKAQHPQLSKLSVAKRISEWQLAPCGFDQARNILKQPFDGDPWKNKVG